MITVIAFILYGTTVHILHVANNRFLSHEVDLLSKILKKYPKNEAILEQKVIDIPYSERGSVYHYYIRILNENNQTVIETPQMGKVFYNADFFNKANFPVSKENDWWNSALGDNYLLIRAPVHLGKSQKQGTILIALDISYQQKMIRKYLWFLTVCLLIGTIFVVLLGYIIARKAMSSLYELTDATKKITATSLQQLDPESWPKELQTLAKAFNQMLKRIEVSFSHLVQFSADLAHELRTPINNLMGETEILLSRPCSLMEYQQVLGSNLEELQRISQIIDNILFLARTENISLEIKKTPIKAAQEIALICDFYQAMADEKNIKINSHTNDIILNANTVMFRRIISNIISNALKYTPCGGLIEIVIKEIENEVQINVNDNGIGIPNEHLPKIFNRFYRIDSARSKHSGGTGLGLAIVKSIMELHHGLISISSEVGKGTQVLLSFPK